jgi:hypothetical protein
MIFLYSAELHLSHAGLVLQPSVSIMPFDAINTSDHTLIKVEITTQIRKLTPKSAKVYTKPAWDKCNSHEYKKIIQTEIRKQKNTIKLRVNGMIAILGCRLKVFPLNRI